jgi:hypothetical protein
LPKIRFADLPRGLWQHLLERAQERELSLADLMRLQEWLSSEPDERAGLQARCPALFKASLAIDFDSRRTAFPHVSEQQRLHFARGSGAEADVIAFMRSGGDSEADEGVTG